MVHLPISISFVQLQLIYRLSLSIFFACAQRCNKNQIINAKVNKTQIKPNYDAFKVRHSFVEKYISLRYYLIFSLMLF